MSRYTNISFGGGEELKKEITKLAEYMGMTVGDFIVSAIEKAYSEELKAVKSMPDPTSFFRETLASKLMNTPTDIVHENGNGGE